MIRYLRCRALACHGATLLFGWLAFSMIGCSAEPPVAEPPPPKVTVQHPEERELVDYDEYNGWTDASATVEVRARVRGHINKVHFTDGQHVKTGDLLFELDPRPFQSEIDRAKEQLNIARAQGDVATKELERNKELLDREAVSVQEYEQAEAIKKSWDAQIVAAQEEVKRRELDLTYSRIDAPIDGRISRALLTQGNLVNAGGSDPLLTTIVDTDPIRVYFSVDERALLEYRERRRATDEKLDSIDEAKIPFEFGLETDTGFPNKGLIDFADNKIDPSTGTIEVRGHAENPDERFVAGGRVRVRVPVSDPYSSILIPETAILTDQDKKYVLCLNDKNVVVRRDIKPGKLLDDGMRAVLPASNDESGLSTEDWIIVLGLQRARINYPVEPVDAEAENIALAE